MSQLATIFEKIKQEFYVNLNKEERENHEIIFSPFSAGFTHDDFLFLDSNNANDKVIRYYDELLEFSETVNTIPNSRFWTMGESKNDFLYNPFKTIVKNLRLLDIDTLKVSMLYGTDLLQKVFTVFENDDKDRYIEFYELNKKIVNEIIQLKKSLNTDNEMVINLQVKLKEDNLQTIEKEWSLNGLKTKVEQEIIEIVKDEFKRFLNDFIELKGKIETLKRNHVASGVDFYLTYCTPNNLYQSDEINWRKIVINKKEVGEISKSLSNEDYKEIFGNSEIKDIEIEEISFEILFVTPMREWFDENLLTSHFWKLTVLNKEEIDIPRYTSKLIYVRNVDLKINKKFIKSNKNFTKQLYNIGPFIMNHKQLMTGSVKLQSQNKVLNIDRNVIFNLSKTISSKTKKGVSSKNLILSKKLQLMKVAPRIQLKAPQKKQLKPKLLINRKFNFAKLNLQTQFFLTPKLHFTFKVKNQQTKQLISINSDDFKILVENKEIIPKLITTNFQLSFSVYKLNKMKLLFDKEGFVKHEILLTFNSNEIKLKKANRTFNLTPISIIKAKNNEFQLIGVVCKAVNKYPNYIKEANYI